MEMSNKLKFLVISTCVLMHFIDLSNAFYIRENEDIVDDLIQMTDNTLNPEISFDEQSRIIQPNLLDNTTEASTTFSSEISTTDNSLLVNKIIGDIQNITLREGKSLTNNLTIELPENNEEIIKTQLKEIYNSELTTEISLTDVPLSTSTILPETIVNKNKLDEIINSTNSEQNSVSLNENLSESSENLIDSRSKEQIEIQKITTGEDLEESIKKAVRDEILSETPIDQNTLDVLGNIPDPELRETIAKDILGDYYLRRSELNANVDLGGNNVKYETILPDSAEFKEPSSNARSVEEKKDIEQSSESSQTSQTQIDENTLNETENAVPEITVTEIITEAPESIAHTTIVPEGSESESTTIEPNQKLNKEDESSKNILTGREGRSMGLSNAIRNHEDITTPAPSDTTTTPSSIELETEIPTTEMSNLSSVRNLDEERKLTSFENNENITENPNSESMVENKVETTTPKEELETKIFSTTDTEESTTTPNFMQNEFEVLPQEGELRNGLKSEILEADINNDQKITTESNTEILKDISVLKSLQSFTMTKPDKEDHEILASSGESEIFTTTFPVENEKIFETLVTQKTINLKEDSASDSSDSDSSEETKNGEGEMLAKKYKKKDDKSDSSDSSIEEESDEKLEKKEKKKFKTSPNPKGRSFSVYSTSQLVETSTEVFTSPPNNLDSEDSASDDSDEHMIMKKPSAESEDENSIFPMVSTIKTIDKHHVKLNPSLKILLPRDETERIPQLIFETTTLLPLKIFKSHPLRPVVTDDIPNETNFAPRTLLDEIQPSQHQKEEDDISKLLETESTTRLIGETFPNHSTSSDEIMAASSIAEALPNQHIKSIESSMNPTLVILICVSIIVMIIAVLVVTFFRFRTPQGVLDIEMQEQRHGKDNNDDDDESDNNHQNDYNCCTTTRSSTSGIDDTLSNSVSCSLVTTSSTTSKTKSTSSISTAVKRSISDSRSNNISEQSVSLLSSEINDEQQNKEQKIDRVIPTEMCKLIPKIKINGGDNNFDDNDENL